MPNAHANFGKNKILMFRKLKDAATATAGKLALQVDHSIDYAAATSSTATKDGAVTLPGTVAVTVAMNAIVSDDEVNQMLHEAVVDGEKIECWEVDLDEAKKSGEKYAALYMQGSLSSWNSPKATEGLETFSSNMLVDGKPQRGFVTLTGDQEEEISYAFRDVTPAVIPDTEVAITSAVQDGGETTSVNSTGIVITFDVDVVGLTADHITLAAGTGSATKGALTGSKKVWTLAITDPTEGDVTILIDGLAGYAFPVEATTVAIFAASVG